MNSLSGVRRSVKYEHGLASVAPLHGGVVTVVQPPQRPRPLLSSPHYLVTDGAFEERGSELPYLAAPPPTPERMIAILARVHDAILAQDPDAELDLDPTLATCVQQPLRGRVSSLEVMRHFHLQLLALFALCFPIACNGGQGEVDSETSTGSSSSTGPEVGDRCTPSLSPDPCGDLLCCSDDPAAQEGKLPAFNGTPISDVYGVPIFAEANNSLSRRGQCVAPESDRPLSNDCPSPCNPRWDAADVSTICGTGRLCCQSQALTEDDCIIDPDTGRWRAVTGADIFLGLSSWGDRHPTAQDPNATGCSFFAGTTDVSDPTYSDCLIQLNVADQRGWCADTCPCVEDTCELRNVDAVPQCS